MTVDLRHGDCLDVLPTLPDCSVDSIVTDPPYELGFMGKKWDNSGIAYNVTLWQECLRVLKPGGHLLAFGGTRTYHRMACAIEDAGFEIRDSIHWLYGSGFPKSLDVSKAIDKMDASEEQKKRQLRFTTWVRSTGVTSRQIDEATGTNMGGHYTTAASQPAVMTREHLEACRHLFSDIPAWVERECDIRSVESRNMAEREIIGKSDNGIAGGTGEHAGQKDSYGFNAEFDITAPATEQAKQWTGWGTALKPAHEPIVVARKPLTGTVAANVLEYGTGAINIDASRIGTGGHLQWSSPRNMGYYGGSDTVGAQATQNQAGRWPANVILSHHDTCTDTCTPGCPVALLDEQSGLSKSTKASNNLHRQDDDNNIYGHGLGTISPANTHGDSGGASRFFYCAKPSRRERNAGLDHLEKKQGGSMTGAEYRPDRPTNHPVRENHHPTVKPLALMRYLVRLVTPPNGTVLEPFAGSGTTLMACVLEGFNAIGIEMTDEYLPIIQGRIAWAEQQANEESPQQELQL